MRPQICSNLGVERIISQTRIKQIRMHIVYAAHNIAYSQPTSVLLEQQSYNVLMIYVLHNQYHSISLMQIKELFKPELADDEKVLIDVKSLYRMDELKASEIRYWRL